MPYEELLVEKSEEGIATLTLNAPEKLNAISRKMNSSLEQAAHDIAQDDDVRVVIVTGAGRGFCTGWDRSVTAMQRSREAAPTRSRPQRLAEPGKVPFDAFPRLDKPVIAAINGPCVSGGLALALSCDMRIAAENAFFSVALVTVGLVPDAGLTYYLPMAVGFSRALELMFTAERFTAAQAKEFGMVSRVVPPDDLLSAANELALKIAAHPPISIELTKKTAWRARFDGLMRQVDMENAATRIGHTTEDHHEATRAFFEKRPPPPRYPGR